MSAFDDGLVDRAVDELRRPVPLDPGLDARILAAIAAERPPAVRSGAVAAAWAWLRRPRQLQLSPLAGLAAAAVLAVALWRPWIAAPTPGAPPINDVQFVYVDPGASSVSVVGDFNDWDPAATPLDRVRPGGVWTVSVPLEPGRHRYAFVVDGTRWAPDPSAPRAAGEDFGTPNSVVTVGGTS